MAGRRERGARSRREKKEKGGGGEREGERGVGEMREGKKGGKREGGKMVVTTFLKAMGNWCHLHNVPLVQSGLYQQGTSPSSS